MKKSILPLLAILCATPAAIAQAPAKFEITCNDQMTYNSKGFEVTAGQKVSLTLKNVGKIPLKTMGHNLVLEGVDGASTAIISPGETASFTVTLEAGDYTLYCSVGNHRAQGMEVSFTLS